MRIGKIPENVLVRSVLKNVKKNKKNIGPGAGCDGTVVSVDGRHFCVTCHPVLYDKERLGEYVLLNARNNMSAQGAVLTGIMVVLLLPDRTEESTIRMIMDEINHQCDQHQVQLLGGHTELTTGVNRPIVTVTGYGEVMDDYKPYQPSPGDAIVATRWAGMQGTALLCDRFYEQLCSYYAPSFVKEGQKFHTYLSLEEEGRIGRECKVSQMHDAGHGGIFGALWELGSRLKMGVSIDLEKIPLRTQTVEVCERLGINPYELHSGGMMLMITNDPVSLIERLEAQQIPAVVLGMVTKEKDRVCYLKGEKSFLTPTRRDQLSDLYFGERTKKENGNKRG